MTRDIRIIGTGFAWLVTFFLSWLRLLGVELDGGLRLHLVTQSNPRGRSSQADTSLWCQFTNELWLLWIGTGKFKIQKLSVIIRYRSQISIWIPLPGAFSRERNDQIPGGNLEIATVRYIICDLERLFCSSSISTISRGNCMIHVTKLLVLIHEVERSKHRN